MVFFSFLPFHLTDIYIFFFMNYPLMYKERERKRERKQKNGIKKNTRHILLGSPSREFSRGVHLAWIYILFPPRPPERCSFEKLRHWYRAQINGIAFAIALKKKKEASWSLQNYAFFLQFLRGGYLLRLKSSFHIYSFDFSPPNADTKFLIRIRRPFEAST